MKKELSFRIEPYYKFIIYDDGNVDVFSFSKHKKGNKLSQYLNKDGYLKVKINNYSHLIHRLIATHFFGEHKLLTVNHKNCNKLDNHPNNLEFVSIADNIKHAIENGMHVSNDPKRNGRYKDGRCADLNAYKLAWYHKNKFK